LPCHLHGSATCTAQQHAAAVLSCTPCTWTIFTRACHVHTRYEDSSSADPPPPHFAADRPGPAPASSPLRARFDSPDGRATISVVVKGAQTIKPSFLQVSQVLQANNMFAIVTACCHRCQGDQAWGGRCCWGLAAGSPGAKACQAASTLHSHAALAPVPLSCSCSLSQRTSQPADVAVRQQP
jgi:hypothetical protein